MNYTVRMIAALLALVLLVGPAGAQDAKPAEKAPAGKTTLELVDYFLKVPISEANPKLIDPFLQVDPETLPKKLRRKVQGRQIEISTLLKLHETKKAGSLIQPSEVCTGKEMILPLDQAEFYKGFGYEEVNEDELQYVMNKTKCTEIDLGCRFSLKIFFKKGKDRRLEFYASDPIMGIVAETRGKGGGGTRFFGIGLTCLH
jgi:hypothetical protein